MEQEAKMNKTYTTTTERNKEIQNEKKKEPKKEINYDMQQKQN